jgi:hypothetical protein
MGINFSGLVDQAEQVLTQASPRTNLLCVLGGGVLLAAGAALSQESSLAGMLVEDIGAVPFIAGAQAPILRAMGMTPPRQNHESNVE